MDRRQAMKRAARVGEPSAEAPATILDRIEQLNPALSAFTELRPWKWCLPPVLWMRRGPGESLSPLAGMPWAPGS